MLDSQRERERDGFDVESGGGTAIRLEEEEEEKCQGRHAVAISVHAELPALAAPRRR